MRRRNIFIAVLLLLLLIIVLIVSIELTSSRSSFFGRASTLSSDEEISSENSYVFASPLSAQSGNIERIRVTVFVLNSKGLGAANKKVTLVVDKGVTISEIQSNTDNFGKALFDIMAANSGDYLVEAKTGSIKLSQKVRVTFR